MKSISVKPKWQISENLRNSKCQSLLGVGAGYYIYTQYIYLVYQFEVYWYSECIKK